MWFIRLISNARRDLNRGYSDADIASLRKKWEKRKGWSVDARALTEAERVALNDGVLGSATSNP